MTDDTLSPVGFERPVVKTVMEAQERYALACLRGQLHEKGWPLVRELIKAGLDVRGWPEERRIMAYAEYAAYCVASGRTNQFEG